MKIERKYSPTSSLLSVPHSFVIWCCRSSYQEELELVHCFLTLKSGLAVWLDLTNVLCCAWLLCHVWLFMTPWAVACQAPLSMGILQERILIWQIECCKSDLVPVLSLDLKRPCLSLPPLSLRSWPSCFVNKFKLACWRMETTHMAQSQVSPVKIVVDQSVPTELTTDACASITGHSPGTHVWSLWV